MDDTGRIQSGQQSTESLPIAGIGESTAADLSAEEPLVITYGQMTILRRQVSAPRWTYTAAARQRLWIGPMSANSFRVGKQS